ncbi:MAG: type II secretion system protein [Puniceicoccales bacterium]
MIALPHRRKGFTLVEIMIVVVIIGMLAAMVMPAFNRVRRASQNTRFFSDVRVFSGAIDTYMLEEGAPPEDFGSGEIGTPLDEYIKPSDFGVRPSIGGSWNVEGGDGGLFWAAVGADGYTVADDQIQEMDDKFDDGNLASGKLRQAGGSGYYWVMEE